MLVILSQAIKLTIITLNAALKCITQLDVQLALLGLDGSTNLLDRSPHRVQCPILSSDSLSVALVCGLFIAGKAFI